MEREGIARISFTLFGLSVGLIIGLIFAIWEVLDNVVEAPLLKDVGGAVQSNARLHLVLVTVLDVSLNLVAQLFVKLDRVFSHELGSLDASLVHAWINGSVSRFVQAQRTTVTGCPATCVDDARCI
jgi:hypothetical protein